MPRRFTVAVDLDATLAQYERWVSVFEVGEPLPGAGDFLEELSLFADVVIYSTRCNTPDGEHVVREWLDRHGMKYSSIWTASGKPLCAAIVDDRAVTCRPQDDPDAYSRALDQVRGLCGAA